MLVQGSTIYSNTAGVIPATGGGGIYVVSYGNLTVNNSNIYRNQSQGPGGGVFNEGGTATLNGDFLGENTARTFGAGTANSGTLNAYDSSFTNNVVTAGLLGGGGGGFYNEGTATLTRISISENHAINDFGGGGIMNKGSSLTLNYVNVVNNSSINKGFGIDSGGGLAVYTGTVQINRSTIDQNSGIGGGGIYVNQGKANLDSSTVSNNTASRGAGVYNVSLISLTNSTVSGNSANLNPAIARGGGLYDSQDSTAIFYNRDAR